MPCLPRAVCRLWFGWGERLGSPPQPLPSLSAQQPKSQMGAKHLPLAKESSANSAAPSKIVTGFSARVWDAGGSACLLHSFKGSWFAPKTDRGAVLFPLHANELSCSGSSKAGWTISCGLHATPKTLGMAAPKQQGEAPWWKPALPCSGSKSCAPPPRWRGRCCSASVVPEGIPCSFPLPWRAVLQNLALSHEDEFYSCLCFVFKSTRTILYLSLSTSAHWGEFLTVLPFMPTAPPSCSASSDTGFCNGNEPVKTLWLTSIKSHL